MKPTLIAEERPYELHLYPHFQGKRYPHWIISGPGLETRDWGENWQALGVGEQHQDSRVSLGGASRQGEAMAVLKALHHAYVQGMVEGRQADQGRRK